MWKQTFKGGLEARGVHYLLTKIFEGYDILQRDLKWKEREDLRVQEG
jgi:hypothetical protein